ncbi:MAG: class I adenylate cyclase [Pseudomonadales bacterium]
MPFPAPSPARQPLPEDEARNGRPAGITMNFRATAPGTRPEVDVKALQTMGYRFSMHHRQRYLHAQAKLDGDRRAILSALPMLFHVNHPALPGYAANMPAGISGFQPGPADLTAIRRFARSVDVSSAPRQKALDAIFLMGSGGSLGHTADSDIDLWVCCDRALHGVLGRKLRDVESWAAEHGLALQGFMVDPRFFADAGDPVHSPLLLDEFYRSGIHLAGRQPLWWFVDGSSADRYFREARHLLHHRFIAPEAVIDFGPVGVPDSEALCRAGALELERALTTPHKSLLKLALVEAYLNTPERPLLSSHYQQLMFTGVSDISRLDTYYMLYEYLAAQEPLRRTTFRLDELQYLFVRKIVARGRELPTASLVARDVASWGYSPELLRILRQPGHFTLARAFEERTTIAHLVQKGMQLGNRLALLSPAVRADIERLQAVVDRQPDPMAADYRLLSSSELAQLRPQLDIRYSRQRWRLTEQGRELRHTSNWPELLLWVHCLGVNTDSLHMPDVWLQHAAEAWLRALSARFDALLFFNPFPDPHDAGERLISAFNDPLSYGGLKTCKARAAILVVREDDTLRVTEYLGEPEIAEAIAAAARQATPPQLAVADRGDAPLVTRVRSLLTEARTALVNGQTYAFALGRNQVTLRALPDGNVRPTISER